MRQVLEDDREKRQTMVNPSNTRVHIDVVDINDNPPHFNKDTFYAGVYNTSIDDPIIWFIWFMIWNVLN